MQCTFPLGDVLSGATGRWLCQRPYEIIAHMWQRSCSTPIEYLAMFPEAKLWILQQYPQFSEETMAVQFSRLDLILSGQPVDLRKSMVLAWLAELVSDYGNQFQVTPIPPQNRRPIDIVEETRLLVPPSRRIEV